jgi:REP element-mobilizing transposase RayT
MARPLRVEFAEAAYHVMARGNERKAIFRDDRDRRRFLETLAEMVERFGVRVQAYCLMPNHYHLLLETPRGNLSQALGWLQVTYTVRFNRRHRRSGHLFQGRFKAQLIEADEYAQRLVEYVHLNPVRPRQRNERLAPERAEELDRYCWSSHRAYAGLDRKSPSWLSQQWLRYWGEEPTKARREYRKSLARWFAGEVQSPWDNLIGGLVLGGEALLAKAQAQLQGKKAEEETRWLQRCHKAELRDRLNKWLGSEPDERLKIWARVRLAGERCASVARELGYRDGGGVGQVVRRLELRSAEDVQLRKKLARIRANLSRVRS